MDQRPSCRHILAIPYMLTGHMTPMVQLCKMLIAKGGCRVTMVSVERNLPSLLKLLPKEHEQHHIKVITISEGLPLDLGPPNWDTFRNMLHARNDPHHGLLRSLELHIPSLPDIACVISDAHFDWTQDLANQLGVPRIVLWASAAAEFHVYRYAQELIKLGKLPFKAPIGREGKGIDNMLEIWKGRPPVYHSVDEGCDGIEEKLEVPGLQPLSRRDFPTFLQIEDPCDVFFYRWIDNVKICSQASLVLFNSFDALEGSLIAFMRSQYGIPAHPIGPLFLLQNVVLKEQDQNEDGDQHKRLEEVPTKSLAWLDNQKPRSALYVAFGTVVKLTKAQINELALGLKESKQPFIWVLPDHSNNDGEGEKLPKDFLDDVKGKGLVVDWAPQQKILRHPSIGGFLSHCGWNSTMEAICSGVPMIGLPYVSDQMLHCKMMVEEWKVALRLEKNHDGIALAQNISMLIQEILLKERGRNLRNRSQELMIYAKNSIQVGGSSHLTLDAIIKLIN